VQGLRKSFGRTLLPRLRDDRRRRDTAGVDWPAPLTVRQVAAELRCSEDEVRTLIREGELDTVACGIRPGLVPRHQLDDYLRRHPSARPASPSAAS
jgi:excisionase family DNA binding protein